MDLDSFNKNTTDYVAVLQEIINLGIYQIILDCDWITAQELFYQVLCSKN